jgi:tetratricopeptide (TPR) repeat protein
MKHILKIFLALSLLAIGTGAAGQGLEELLARRDYGGAILAIDSSLADGTSLSPESRRSLIISKARCLRQLNKFRDAVNLLEQERIESENDPFFLCELAESQEAAGDSAALSTYTLLSEQNPDNLYFKIQKCKLEYRNVEYPLCIATAKEIFARDSIEAILSLVGDVYKAFMETDSALFYYHAALRQNPEARSTLLRAADFHIKLGENDEAIRLATSYLDAHPDDVLVNEALGTAQYRNGDLKDAFGTFTRLIEELKDTSYASCFFLGAVAYEMGRFDTSASAFMRAYSIDSSANSAYHYAMARARCDRKFKDEAIRYFNIAEKLMVPDSSFLYQIYSGRAYTYFIDGAYRKARADYQKAVSFNPGYTDGYFHIAYCYEQEKNYKEAIRWLERYLRQPDLKPSKKEWAEGEIKYLKGEAFMHETSAQESQ